MNKSCEICGAIRKQNRFCKCCNKTLCQKHYNQFKKYGRCLDNNPFIKYDKNKIITSKDYAEIEIRNKNNEVVANSKIDLEDIDKCKDIIWCLSAGYAVSHTNKNLILLHRLVMNASSDYQVDHINGDRLDNRKQNLRLCKIQENCRNSRGSIKNSSSGILGVRKDIRCKNSWRAQIYVNKSYKLEKTYRDKDLAIIQRLIWELIYFKEFAPQIELIKSDYSYLLGINKLKNMTFNSDINLIKEIGNKLKSNPHCPCMLKQVEETICPCLPCRNMQNCHCGMFVPIDDSNDPQNIQNFKTNKTTFNPDKDEFIKNYNKLNSSRKMAKLYETSKTAILLYAHKINYTKIIEKGDNQ